jgi:cold shock CspA family protein/tetratricopeptide (TPR) repeat protein
MLCVPVLNSLAELTYLTQLDFLELQKSLQQLLTTNMIVMTSIPTGSSFETRYAISDLPREYMLKHHPVRTDEYADLIQRRNQMESQGEQIRAEASGDQWAITSIDMRSKRDLIVARYLLDALADSDRGNFTRAAVAVDMARQLAPEYYEVYRVEAAVKTREKNYPAAIYAYEAALELEPASAKVRHAFGIFHLICLSDSERAVEQFKEGLKIRPNSFHLQSDYVRALFYLKRFEEARVVLDELLSRAPTNRHVLQRIKLADLNLQYYSRRADFFAASGSDVKTILSDLESLIHEFKQIRPEWVDDKMKRRLMKSIPNARKCLREISAGEERSRAETVLIELYEMQPVVSNFFPKNTHRGSVVRVFQSKGFGFISTDEGKELFFGIDGVQVKKEWKEIIEGTPVDFKIGQNKKGACAVNVRIRKMIPGT